MLETCTTVIIFHAMDPRETFFLDEYTALRKEIEIFLSEARSLERYTIIACGLIWGWLITNRNSNWVLWSIPAALTAVSFIRGLAVRRHFADLKRYIKKTEDHFDVKGWEHRPPSWLHLSIGVTELLISSLLFVLSVLGFLYRAHLIHP
jgi:hypothetical protein